ncbi:DUF1311 domain-containing protein [Labrenzia sp. PO1]|uniref:DUF1311 domain-containing protein n=1 Tax=Labrenzia sp. PO1 TaxID=2720390 RepID=UPI0014459664|nr:DUF1311 domain-containing protein [Labrenzia sp. PO1]NKI58150.1 DUF1311 domain-containing protein [Labrenzia sp. PO1]
MSAKVIGGRKKWFGQSTAVRRGKAARLSATLDHGKTLRPFLAFIVLLAGTSSAVTAQTPDPEPKLPAGLEAEIESCKADPANRIGGAAIGECLEDRAAERRAELDRRREKLAERLCNPAHTKQLFEGGKTWEALRQSECGLLGKLPGNTASYINMASCEMTLALQQSEALALLEDFANPWCPSYELVEDASRKGEPVPGEAVEIVGSSLSWTFESTPDARIVVSDSVSGEVVPLDISGCSFCSGDADNCEQDGIYTMREDPERPLFVAVCHKGAHSQRLTLFDPVVRGSEPVVESTGEYFIEWQIQKGRLEYRPDGAGGAVWPEYD